jgi:DNA-directed RNA polymerase subunit delta
MPDYEVAKPYVEMNSPDPSSQANRAEDEPDLDGYDDAQRAEIALVEGDGPNDGVVMTDMQPDLGEDLDEDEIEDGADIPDDVIDTDDGIIR